MAATADDLADARAAFDGWLDAFNADDHEREAGYFHYPHVLLGGANLIVCDGPAAYLPIRARIAEALRESGWRRTVVESIEPVQHSSEKVHFAARFAREREDGTRYERVDGLWVATKEDGRWGCRLRSAIAENPGTTQFVVAGPP